jgi:exopolysaccharide biosynthesis polyprenyl glycosylphosphotransferase
MSIKVVNRSVREKDQDQLLGYGSGAGYGSKWNWLSRAKNGTLFSQQKTDKTALMHDLFARQGFDHLTGSWLPRLFILSWVIRNKVKNCLKRLLDLSLSFVALIFLLPFMALIAAAIRLDAPGPVLFKQERVGKWGRTFICYKFRSMYLDAEKRKAELLHLNEADGVVFKMAKDPRVTRVGRIIRKLSLDELPQIFNVLKGEMSWVGPRPPVPYEVDNYKYEYMGRLDAIPGITGLQQVSGRSDLDFERWVELDLLYIEEQSLVKDIEILLKTIPAVISGRGAY